MKYCKTINTKIGKITIVEENNKIIEIWINQEIKEDLIKKDTELLEETKKQLEEYLDGKRKNFSVPLNPKGNDFMKKVWTRLQKIPYGEVKSYRADC